MGQAGEDLALSVDHRAYHDLLDQCRAGQVAVPAVHPAQRGWAVAEVPAGVQRASKGSELDSERSGSGSEKAVNSRISHRWTVVISRQGGARSIASIAASAAIAGLAATSCGGAEAVTRSTRGQSAGTRAGRTLSTMVLIPVK